ncbi:MAG: hypothetical protein ACOC86_05085 [Candidatus Bipolaricaulota bacterium]
MYYARKISATALAALLIGGLIIPGAALASRGDTILEADRLTISAEETVADGNVKLTRPDWSLTSDYLELKGQEGTEGIDARGNVTLKSEEFTVRGDRLSGTLAEEGADGAIVLTLHGAEGSSESVSFSGDEIDFAIKEEGLTRITIESNSELSFDDSTLSGSEIRAKKVEGGWDFKVTGDPKYEAGSTRLRAETITGTAFTEPEDSRQGRDPISRKTTARGEVQLTRPSWTMHSNYLELKETGDTEELSAKGAVRFALEEEYFLSGSKASITEIEEGWNFEVSEEAKFEGETTTFRGNKIAGRITTGTNEKVEISNITAEGISGGIELRGSGGEARKIRFLGESANFEFDDSSALSRVDFETSSFTTCEGCECDGGCAYSISADRTSLIENDFVLARFAKQKTFGIPVGWSPLYFLTLKDVGLPERPYFPRVGYSAEDGLSLSGALPVFLDVNHFGNVVLDYFSRDQGVGVGLDYYSGGDTVAGNGEIYGIHRVFGDNFYKLDGAFDLNPADWLEISTDLTVKQGEYRGTNYDQNEWSLGVSGREFKPNWEALVSRTEKSEDDEETTHAIERLPEITLSRSESLEGFPLSYGLRTSIGYYRENKAGWSAVRSGGRGMTGGDFRFEAPRAGPLNFSLAGEGWVNPYLVEPEDGITARAWANLEPELKIEGPGRLNLRFVHRERYGESPFDFDAVERRDRLSLNYGSSQGIFDQSLSFHYDFVPDDGFSEAKYSIGFQRYSLDQKFTVNYDISGASLSSIKTNSTYSRGKIELNLSSGYDFDGRSISETTVGLKFSSEETAGSIQLKSDPLETWLKKVSGELDLEFFDTWSLGLKGEYDVQSGKLSSLSYSLHKALQNCLKVGITGSKSGFWFDVELVGF